MLLVSNPQNHEIKIQRSTLFLANSYLIGNQVNYNNKTNRGKPSEIIKIHVKTKLTTTKIDYFPFVFPYHMASKGKFTNPTSRVCAQRHY
jgi:hypothetical protein